MTKGHSGKNLSETGIFSWCPLCSLWPTARYKHKEFLIQRLYLSRNLTRSSHWRSLVLKTHSKERRGGRTCSSCRHCTLPCSWQHSRRCPATSNCGRPAPVSSTTLGGQSSQSHGGHGQCHGRAGGLLGHTHVPCTCPGFHLSPTHLISVHLLQPLVG